MRTLIVYLTLLATISYSKISMANDGIRLAVILDESTGLSSFQGPLEVFKTGTKYSARGTLKTIDRPIQFSIPIVESNIGIEGAGSMQVQFNESEGGGSCPLNIRISLVGNEDGSFEVYVSHPSQIPKDIWSCAIAQSSPEQTKIVSHTAWIQLLDDSYILAFDYLGNNLTSQSPNAAFEMDFNVKNSDPDLGFGQVDVMINVAKPTLALTQQGVGPYAAWPRLTLRSFFTSITWSAKGEPLLGSGGGDWLWQPSPDSQSFLLPVPRRTDGVFDYFVFSTRVGKEVSLDNVKNMGSIIDGVYSLRVEFPTVGSNQSPINLWAGNFKATADTLTSMFIYPVAKKSHVLFRTQK